MKKFLPLNPQIGEDICVSGIPNTAWKVPKYGVFSGPYFPVFGLNTEITK